MNKCKYQLDFDDEVINFESEELLNEFLIENYSRVKQKINGQKISASKPDSISQSASDIQVKLNAIKITADVENEYDSDLGTSVEHALGNLKKQGYVGISTHINEKTFVDNGVEKKIIMTYNKQNHQNQLAFRYIADLINISTDVYSEKGLQDSPEQLEEYLKKKEEVLGDPVQKEKLENHLKDTLDIYARQNIAGRMVHAGLEAAFNFYQTIGNIERFKKEFTPAHLNQVIERSITGLEDEQFEHAKAIIYNMIVGSQGQNNGLIDKLNLANQQYVFPEFALSYENTETGTKLVGIIDLIVVDNSGKVFIYDFKTAGKSEDMWSRVKLFRINQQLGYYNAMLKANGIVATDVQYVPIVVSTNDYYDTISSLDTNNPITVKTALTSAKLGTEKDYYRRIRNAVASDIPETLKKTHLRETESLPQIDKFLREALNVDYRDKTQKIDLEKRFEKIWNAPATMRDEMGKLRKGFWNQNTKEYNFLPEEENAQREQFLKEAKKHLEEAQGEQVISGYEDAIIRYKNARTAQSSLEARDNIPFVLKTSGQTESKTNSIFRKTFGKYRSDDWVLLENSTASQLGILIFVNQTTKTADFVQVSRDSLLSKHRLETGSTLLGKFKSDVQTNSKKELLKSTVGNVELIKIMAFLNFNIDTFIAQGFRIGEIKAINPFSQGVFENFDKLKYNFYELLKEVNIKEAYTLNRSDIITANPIESLLAKIISIDDYREASKYGFESPLKLQTFTAKMKAQKNKLADGWLWGSAQKEILDILTEELKIRLDEKELKSYSNPQAQDYFTKMLVDQINFYTNSYVPHYEQDLQKSTLQFNSIKNLDSPIINATTNILTTSISNIKRRFLDYKEDMYKITQRLFEENNYPKIRRYTLGDHSNAFTSLFEVDPATGKIDRRFLTKDPYKDKSLNESQKAYLIKFLTHLKNTRNPEETQTIEELSKAGNTSFREVPLIKMQSLSFLKKGKYGDWIKQMSDKTNNAYLNIFGEEPNDPIQKEKQFLQVHNFLSGQLDSKAREELLESGISKYETDLEIVSDMFSLAYYRAEEFNKALPLIQSVKVQSMMDNAGILKDIEPLISFIDNHLKIVVKGEKLVDDKEKSIDKSLTVMRQLTSVMNLMLNPISIVREMTQALYGAMSRAQFHHYGENTHSLKHISKQYLIIMGHASKDLYSDMNIIESLNIQHGLSNMALPSMIDRSSTSKTGLPHLMSNYLQGFNRAPEYMTRMGVLIAELLKDNAWKAYSFDAKQSKLIYDWKKDGRFSAYAKGQKSHPQYNDQRSLWLTLMQEFNRENPDNLLKEGDALPAAYTSKQIESLKSYSDSILGYYDPESKYQVMHTLLGANFFHFKNWMTAVKDKWVLTGHMSTIQGDYAHMKNELGELLYLDPETGELTTDASSGLKALEWQGKWCEGIAVSLGRLFRASKNYGLTEGWQLLKDDKKIQANVKLMIADLLMILLMFLLLNSFFKDTAPEDLNLTSQILKAVVSAPADLQVDKNIKSIVKPQAGWIFPSLSYFARLGEGQKDVIVGDKSFQKYFFSAVGALRPFQHELD